METTRTSNRVQGIASNLQRRSMQCGGTKKKHSDLVPPECYEIRSVDLPRAFSAETFTLRQVDLPPSIKDVSVGPEFDST